MEGYKERTGNKNQNHEDKIDDGNQLTENYLKKQISPSISFSTHRERKHRMLISFSFRGYIPATLLVYSTFMQWHILPTNFCKKLNNKKLRMSSYNNNHEKNEEVSEVFASALLSHPVAQILRGTYYD